MKEMVSHIKCTKNAGYVGRDIVGSGPTDGSSLTAPMICGLEVKWKKLHTSRVRILPNQPPSYEVIALFIRERSKYLI